MIYVYFGSDYGQVVHDCFNDLKKISNNTTILKFDGFNTYVQDIVSEGTSISLFENKKIIVYEHCYFLSTSKIKAPLAEKKQNYNSLLSYIDNKDSSDMILLVPGNLDSKNTIVIKLKEKDAIFNQSTLMDLDAYIEYGKKIAKSQSKEITSKSLELLFERTKRKVNYVDEGDFLHFTNELNKVLEYSSKIEEKDIEKLVIKPLEDDIFQTATSLLNKNIASSVSSYLQLRSIGYETLNLLPIFVSQFKDYALLKNLIEQNKSDVQIMDQLKMSKGRLYYSKKAVSFLSYKTFVLILNKLAEIEKGIKLYSDNPDSVLLQFLLTFNLVYKK